MQRAAAKEGGHAGWALDVTQPMLSILLDPAKRRRRASRCAWMTNSIEMTVTADRGMSHRAIDEPGVVAFATAATGHILSVDVSPRIRVAGSAGPTSVAAPVSGAGRPAERAWRCGESAFRTASVATGATWCGASLTTGSQLHAHAQARRHVRRPAGRHPGRAG